jgi:hypothetical protein
MMRNALALSLVVAAVIPTPPRESSERPREFWVSLATSGLEVPAGEKPFDLLLEMNTLLASPDPVLRDDVAYGAAARWVFRRRLLTPDEQKRLVDMWSRNLTEGLRGGRSEDAYRRSFSALNLSIMAALDNEASFLSSEDHAKLLSDALTYLDAERDRRGYDVDDGWVHATAHTADLLKFLARSSKLTRADQARVLEALAKTCLTRGVFTWAEDERLAQVVRSVVRRADVDSEAVSAWLAQWPAAHKDLWKAAPRIDPARFAALQNIKMVLRAAYTALAADQDLSPDAAAVRERILQTLAAMR